MIITTEKTRRRGCRRTGPHRGESTIGSGFSSNAAAAAALATIYHNIPLKMKTMMEVIIGCAANPASRTSKPKESENLYFKNALIVFGLRVQTSLQEPTTTTTIGQASNVSGTCIPKVFYGNNETAQTFVDHWAVQSRPRPSRAAVVIAINKLDAIFIAELKSLSCAFRGSQVHQSPGQERWQRWWWFCGTRTAFFRPSHESHVDGQNYQHIPTLLADNHQDSFRP